MTQARAPAAEIFPPHLFQTVPKSFVHLREEGQGPPRRLMLFWSYIHIAHTQRQGVRERKARLMLSRGKLERLEERGDEMTRVLLCHWLRGFFIYLFFYLIAASTRSVLLATGSKTTKVCCVYLPTSTEKHFTHYPEIHPGMMDATATLATGPLKCLWRLL